MTIRARHGVDVVATPPVAKRRIHCLYIELAVGHSRMAVGAGLRWALIVRSVTRQTTDALMHAEGRPIVT